MINVCLLCSKVDRGPRKFHKGLLPCARVSRRNPAAKNKAAYLCADLFGSFLKPRLMVSMGRLHPACMGGSGGGGRGGRGAKLAATCGKLRPAEGGGGGGSGRGALQAGAWVRGGVSGGLGGLGRLACLCGNLLSLQKRLRAGEQTKGIMELDSCMEVAVLFYIVTLRHKLQARSKRRLAPGSRMNRKKWEEPCKS